MQELLNLAKTAAIKAGEELQAIKHPLISTKSDGTPISSADLRANEIICEILSESQIPICSEEAILPYSVRKNSDFWLIDPLDGTSNYLKTRSNYCICISLISGKRPILGLIYDVCKHNIYYSAKGLPVYKNSDILKPGKNALEYALISLRDGVFSKNIALANKHNLKRVNVGSALKFCALLEGDADVYFRFERLNSWDICAGDFLINQFGGLMIGLDKNYIDYNKSDFACAPFLAFARE